jgi:hypothetical protein
MKGLIKEDSDEIGLVVACFIYSAVDYDELRSWAQHVIVTRDSYPLYVVDLLEFKDSKQRIYAVIGFVPDSSLRSQDKATLMQIAYDRHGVVNDCATVAVLKDRNYRSATFIERFTSTFPFLPKLERVCRP